MAFFLTFFILFFSSLGPENLISRYMAGLTTSLPIGRIVGSLYGTAMVCGLSYIVDNFDEVYHQIIQPGKTYHQTIQTEKNDSHDFTSNGTCPAYVRDPLMSTKVEDPATDFWYSNMQIPAPYIQFDNAPWRHAAPDTRKVGAQASPEAFQKMMDFALFGILVYACLLTTFRVLQFIFGGKQQHGQGLMLAQDLVTWATKISTISK